MRMGLCEDSGGLPGALIATTEEKAFTSTGSGHWEEFAFASPPAIAAGSHYWVACHPSVSVGCRGADGAIQNSGRRLIAQAYGSGLPDPYGSGTSYTTPAA